MKFSDFKLILPSVFSNRQNPIELVQAGYRDVVNKISLHLHLFPVLINGAIGLDGFNHIHKYVKNNIESEIAFKEIYSILGVSFSGELVDKEYVQTPGVVGDILDSFHTEVGLIADERILEEKIDIGVISPYKAQVHYLRLLLKKNILLKPYKKLITINTVDGFQGQGRDVIFISLVRSNEDGQIGFLGDLRRMNVAMTRARMKLIILRLS